MITSPIKYVAARINTGVALRRYLHNAGQDAEGAAAIRSGLAERDQRFFKVLEKAVYARPESLYSLLLERAGFSLKDIRSLVGGQGLEGARETLYRAGVYVTHDEMKGRMPVDRGGRCFPVTERDFDNPLIRLHVRGVTSGTTGRPTVTRINFAHYETQLPLTAVECGLLGDERTVYGLWLPPFAAGLSFNMRMAGLGRLPEKWFSQVSLSPFAAPRGQRLDMLGLVGLSNLFGVRIPFPEHVPVSNPAPVVRWVAATLGRGLTVVLSTHPASGVRVARWAAAHGIRLDGAVLVIAGEPVTRAAREAIEASGAACRPYYAASELGVASTPCLAPRGADDVHLCSDRFVVIGRGDPLAEKGSGRRLLFTGLSLAAPKILINAETGDCAHLEQRSCGCPWDDLGYDTHLSAIWSPEKLTAEGLTFEYATIARILELKLPRLLGGAIGDYQLVVRTGPGGRTDYRLLVSPSVKPLDHGEARRVFLEALAAGPEVHRLMAEVLTEAGQFKVVRRAPLWTAAGKSAAVRIV
jgi:hypothetical protein